MKKKHPNSNRISIMALVLWLGLGLVACDNSPEKQVAKGGSDPSQPPPSPPPTTPRVNPLANGEQDFIEGPIVLGEQNAQLDTAENAITAGEAELKDLLGKLDEGVKSLEAPKVLVIADGTFSGGKLIFEKEAISKRVFNLGDMDEQDRNKWLGIFGPGQILVSDNEIITQPKGNDKTAEYSTEKSETEVKSIFETPMLNLKFYTMTLAPSTGEVELPSPKIAESRTIHHPLAPMVRLTKGENAATEIKLDASSGKLAELDLSVAFSQEAEDSNSEDGSTTDCRIVSESGIGKTKPIVIYNVFTLGDSPTIDLSKINVEQIQKMKEGSTEAAIECFSWSTFHEKKPFILTRTTTTGFKLTVVHPKKK